MVCPKYKELQEDSHEEKKFISELLHCVKSNDSFFNVARSIVQSGKEQGLFENTQFGHDLYGKPDMNAEPRKEIEEATRSKA